MFAMKSFSKLVAIQKKLTTGIFAPRPHLTKCFARLGSWPFLQLCQYQ